LDEDIKYYLYAIASARAAGPLTSNAIDAFLDVHFETVDIARTPRSVPRTPDTIEYIDTVISAMNFFVEFCILVFSRGRGHPIFLPRSHALERPRLRRALLRFQLYCELFHQPGDPSDCVSDWETRIPEQKAFWEHWEWWEIEECKCIYYLLIQCLSVSTGPDSPQGNNLKTDSVLRRGIAQLRDFIEEIPPTGFGVSYKRRFQEQALWGFAKAAPSDWSFGPRLRAKNRKFGPLREPHVKLRDVLGSRVGGWTMHPKEPRKALSYIRLLGWCFWESEVPQGWGLLQDWD
jgi:hypothetical protein